MIRRPIPAILLAALLLSACSSFLEPPVRETNRPIQTERLEYTLRADGQGIATTIPYTYTNRTGRTVYVVNCNGASSLLLEKHVDGEWITAWSPIVPMCLSDPIVIAPGETYASSVPVFAGHPSNNVSPRFEVGEIEGVYRLHWPVLVHNYDESRSGFGDPLPVAEKVSNTFVLRFE